MKKISIFAVGVLMCILTACGKKPVDPTPGPDVTGNPTDGGSVIVGITQDLDSLDPHVAIAAGTDEVLFNVFEGLVKADEFGVMQPAVAESYKISDDACVYTFTLRDNVYFHNGDVVTIDDVVYSLKRCAGFPEAADPSVSVESALSIISEINAVDAKTLEIKLTTANTELIYFLTGAIIPKDYKNQSTAPVGTGPFKFESYKPLDSFVIVKNEQYYGEKAHLDKVTFKIFANIEAAFLELKAGKIDLMSQLGSDYANQLKDNYNIEACPFNLVQALFLNNEFEPFKNLKVRQALCYAIDRDAVNQFISEGQGHIIGSGVYPGISEYYAKDLESVYKYDVEKAKSLLKEAGYADGFTFTITIPSSYDQHVATGEVIVEQLKKVGITAKIELVEWASWLTDVYKGRKYEATIIGLDSNLAPSDILKRYRTTASNNFINFLAPEYDTAYAAGVAAVSTADKKKFYNECQKILTDNAASVFIQDPAQLTAVKKGLGGYTPYPIYVLDMSKIYYVK